MQPLGADLDRLSQQHLTPVNKQTLIWEIRLDCRVVLAVDEPGPHRVDQEAGICDAHLRQCSLNLTLGSTVETGKSTRGLG